MRRHAIMSRDGLYRFSLARIWDEQKPRVLFVMLNPSTADAEKDDPTIRRCVGFAKSWGFGQLEVVNLFAFRATKPKDMLAAADPEGADNDWHIANACAATLLHVCAWGVEKQSRVRCRAQKVRGIVPAAHVLQLSKYGSPCHPLMLRGDLQPTPWIV